MPEVEVGQVWKDDDIRSPNRTFKIEAIGSNAADVRVLTADNNTVGRIYTIRLDRFKPSKRGYTLVEG